MESSVHGVICFCGGGGGGGGVLLVLLVMVVVVRFCVFLVFCVCWSSAFRLDWCCAVCWTGLRRCFPWEWINRIPFLASW